MNSNDLTISFSIYDLSFCQVLAVVYEGRLLLLLQWALMNVLVMAQAEVALTFCWTILLTEFTKVCTLGVALSQVFLHFIGCLFCFSFCTETVILYQI